jgi:hypothetical protein
MALIDTKSPAGNRSVPIFNTPFSHDVVNIARKENNMKLNILVTI